MELKTEVLIRTDGGPKIGLGHLTRCTALAHMLKGNFQITFICKEVPDAIVHEIENEGFKVVRIENEEFFFTKLVKNNIAVLDGYNFDTLYQKRVKETGCKLVCIDDLHKGKFFADLIINHSPVARKDNYKAQSHTLYALGLKHSLIRPSFINRIKLEPEIREIGNIFICFGGSDSMNLTERAVLTVMDSLPSCQINVVIGVSFMHLERIQKIFERNCNIYLYRAISESKMVELIGISDLAIAPASSILLELFSVGVPTISGYYVENQKEISEFFGKTEALLSIGNMNNRFESNLKEALLRMSSLDRIEMVNKQKILMKTDQGDLINYFKFLN